MHIRTPTKMMVIVTGVDLKKIGEEDQNIRGRKTKILGREKGGNY